MSRTLTAGFLFFFSLAVILGAWGFELIGGYQPCGLCLQQRIPYYIGVPVALAVFVFSLKVWPERFMQILFGILALVFALSLFYAVRHAGVEWDWWLGPANCGASDLSQSLVLLGSEASSDIKVVYCDEAAGRFLGLSFAGWNAVASVILMLVALRGVLAGPE